MAPRSQPDDSTRSAPSASPRLRVVVYWIARRALCWFYRDRFVLHADRIPSNGPVLFIGNHPNDLPDVLTGYLACPRPVRYIATVSAASNWLSRKTYEWLGVIPVSRVRDMRTLQRAGVDVGAVNRRAMALVTEALAAGDLVGAFPEGGVHQGPSLGSFRSGVASMALNYIESGEWCDATVVPFGLYYEAPQRVGSDVVMQVGQPFALRAWYERQPEGQRTAAALTGEMHRAVSGVTRNCENREQAAIWDHVLAATAAGRGLAAVLGRMTGRFDAAHPEAEFVVRARTTANILADAVASAGGIPTSIADHRALLTGLGVAAPPATASTAAPSSLTTTLSEDARSGRSEHSAARLWLLAPVAALGWALHIAPFFGVQTLARRLAKSPADLAAFAMIPGLYVIVAWYLLLSAAFVAAVQASGGWRGAAWLVLLVPAVLLRLGDVAVSWRGQWRRRRLIARVRRLPAAERDALTRYAAQLHSQWDATVSGAERGSARRGTPD